MSGLFPNALHVARREYLVRVRGRAFAITTALLAVAIAAVTMVPTILAAVGVAEPPQIAVDVQAEDLPADPVLQLQAALIGASGSDPDAERRGSPARDACRGSGRGRAGGSRRRARCAADDHPRRRRRARLRIPRQREPHEPDPAGRHQAFAQQLTIADRLARAGIDQQETAEIFEPPEFTAEPVDPDDAADAG